MKRRFTKYPSNYVRASIFASSNDSNIVYVPFCNGEPFTYLDYEDNEGPLKGVPLIRDKHFATKAEAITFLQDSIIKYICDHDKSEIDLDDCFVEKIGYTDGKYDLLGETVYCVSDDRNFIRRLR